MAEIRRSPVEVQVVFPIIYRVLYIPGGCLGFQPSTVLLPCYYHNSYYLFFVRLFEGFSYPRDQGLRVFVWICYSEKVTIPKRTDPFFNTIFQIVILHWECRQGMTYYTEYIGIFKPNLGIPLSHGMGFSIFFVKHWG